MMETDVLNSKSKFLTEQALSFLVLNALLAALLLLLFVYPFLMGNTLYYRDISHNYYPILQFMKESLQQGQLPFWNPFLFWGTPQVATLEPPLFYPFAWFFFIFDFGPALIINLCVHYVLAAWGMYFFLKSYCLQPWAQVYAAVAWAFGGVLISLYHMHPLLNTVVWIPWLFLCARQYILAESHNKSLRLMWGLSFSLVLALQTLSGHLEIVYFTSLSGLVYVLSLCSNKVNLRSVTQLVFFFCLGMGMAAVQLMPSLAFMPESLRGTGIEVEEAQYFSLPPFHLPGAFVPRFLGDLLSLFNLRPMVGDAELSYNSLLNSVYLGVSTVILACLSGFKKRKETYFWFGLALISLLGALGKYFYFYTSFFLIFDNFFYKDKEVSTFTQKVYEDTNNIIWIIGNKGVLKVNNQNEFQSRAKPIINVTQKGFIFNVEQTPRINPISTKLISRISNKFLRVLASFLPCWTFYPENISRSQYILQPSP